MRDFFYPRSLAVVGVSADPDNLGRNIIHNLLTYGYQGDFWPVGPKGGEVFGRRIYPSLLELPEVPDEVVILAPARIVPRLLEDCGQLGVKRVVVESGGFAELGEEGRLLEDQIREILRRYQMRLVGPNGLGIINLEIGLCLPFMTLPYKPRLGGISLICQSGGVGSNVIAWLAQSGLGMNKFVSVGNKLNVTENDILEFLLTDPGTTLIYLYLEDLADGRRLLELGRQAQKPILLHKANIGGLSAEIARSHTASLTVDDAVVTAACCQARILRVHSRSEFLQAAIALQQPPLKGNRLVVLSRSGGEAVVVADACQKLGFELPPLSAEIQELIRRRSRAGVIRPINPLDLGDVFDFTLYQEVTAAFCQDENIDAIIFNYGPISEDEREAARQTARNLVAMARQYQKPLLVTVVGNLEERRFFQEELGVPVFAFPGEAIRALALAREYYTCQLTPPPAEPPALPALAAIQDVLAPYRSQAGPLPLPAALEVMDLAGLPLPSWQVVTTADEAVAAATAQGLPSCLKLVAPSALHKSDLGGVLLNLATPEAVQEGFAHLARIAANLPAGESWQVLVMPYITGGIEVILGGKRDRAFGPVVIFGAGGIWVEVLEDVALRLAPLDLPTAREMIASTRIYRILQGYRGQPPADLEALARNLVRLATLLVHCPEIQEVDLNPVRVLPQGQGCLILDARVILGEAAAG